MNMKKFTTEQKTNMVLDHLGNRLSLSAISAKYDISVSYFLKVKDKFLNNAYKALSDDRSDNQELVRVKQDLEDTKLALAESQTALSVLKKKI